jgi:hypothetical protein
MTLAEKLERLQSFEQQGDDFWEEYKKQWIWDVNDLFQLITEKWFRAYEANGQMAFDLPQTSIVDPYMGEYLISFLEITLPDQKSFVIAPVTAITTEYNGKLEFYLRGNIWKKVNILRELDDKNKLKQWVVAKSHDTKDHETFTQTLFEKIMESWIS